VAHDELPWWGWVVLCLLLFCCALQCCLLLYCRAVLRAKSRYRPQGKNADTQLRRGGMQRSLNHLERGRLGMSLKRLASSLSGIEFGNVEALSGLDEARHSITSEDLSHVENETSVRMRVDESSIKPAPPPAPPSGANPGA
jgi:hypothetical protein